MCLQILLLFPLLLPVLSQTLTGETGRRAGTNSHSQSATSSGPLLLQDVYTLEKMRRFNTERIPERVVHPRGVAAHGVFQVTRPIPRLTDAPFLTSVKRTPVFARFSTVIHPKGSPETLRDPRGFAVKFFTDVGNFDLVANNLPVFFINDHIKFPDMVHSLKPDPVTNLQHPRRYFDFFSALGGQSTHMLTYIYSDLGIPASYRFMDGNSVHAYKLVKNGNVTYVKFRWSTNQGVRNLTIEEARRVQGRDFSHATRDLVEAIGRGEFPSWTLSVQKLSDDMFGKLDYDPLDATKDWPVDIPFEEVGVMTLNRLPENFHLGSEQVAFSPANFLSGMIEPSEDRLLQGRLISYHETQTHRHGSNLYNRLPVNRPKVELHTYNQDGVMAGGHDWSGSVNYEPNNDPKSFRPDPRFLYSTREICGSYEQKQLRKKLRFRQAGELYRRFDESQRTNLVKNLADELGQVEDKKIREIMCSHFYKADPEYGTRVAKKVKCDIGRIRKLAARLEE